MRALIASLIAVLALSIVPEAAAKTYSAERFDSRIRILPNGAIEVVETVVFRFEGEFKYVYRELSRRRTDDIEIVSAEMDGRTLPFGNESGQVEVRRRSKVRVEWKFAPRADSSHTFVLTYIVRGVVQRDGGRDVLEWVALPTEHDYRIGESQVSLELPVAPLSRPIVDSKRVAELTFEPGGQQLQVFARGIGKNGWVKTRLEFGEGAIIAAAPAWQQRQLAARALAPRWLTAAGIILVAGLLFMFALRQSYDSPWGTAARRTGRRAARHAAARDGRRRRCERRDHASARDGHDLRARRSRRRHHHRGATQVGPAAFHAAPAPCHSPAGA